MIEAQNTSRTVSCAELIARFPDLLTSSIGDLTRSIEGVSSPEDPRPNTALFLAQPKAIAQGFATDAAVLVIPRKLENDPVVQEKIAQNQTTILFSPQVEWAMAKVVDAFFLRTPYTNSLIKGIHPTAFISPDAELASGVRVGPNAFIGSRVRIAKGVSIGTGAVIEDFVEIDEDTVIHPQTYIGHSTQIGKRCEVHPQSVVGKEGFGYAHDAKWNHTRIPHQGRVVLEDDVHIGGCCTIDRATFGETRIGAGTKFDNHVHIAHNCRVGRNSLLTAGFTMAGSSRVGANFVTGGKTVVTGHVEVADNVQLAALSAVSKSVTVPGQYGGNPLQPLQNFIKTKVVMTQLPEMRRQLKRVLKHLGLDDES